MGLGANPPGPGEPRPAGRPGSASGAGEKLEDLDPPDILAVLAEEVAQVRPLEKDEQVALLKRLKAGDTGARARLLETHLQVALTSAMQRQGRGLPVGDLFQEGSIGLFTALGAFTGAGSAEFEAFLQEQVDACLEAALDAEEAALKAERALVAAAEDFDRVELMLARELRRKPTDLEIGTRLEWGAVRTAEVRTIVDEVRRRHDAELLSFIEPEDMDSLEALDLEHLELDEDDRPNRSRELN